MKMRAFGGIVIYVTFLCAFIFAPSAISQQPSVKSKSRGSQNEPTTSRTFDTTAVDASTKSDTTNATSVGTSTTQSATTAEPIITTAAVETPENDRTVNSTLVEFTEPLYMINFEKSKLNSGREIPWGIKLRKKYENKVNFSQQDALNLGIERSFECGLANDNETVRCHLVEDIWEDLAKQVSQFILVLEVRKNATETEEKAASTVLVLNLTKDGNATDADELVFEKATYEIQTLVEYVGVVEQFKARMKSGDEKIIRYGLVVANSTWQQSLVVDRYSGTLRVVRNLEPSIYALRVEAETTDGRYKSEARVVVKVSHIVVCDAARRPAFVYSQLVARVVEGKTADDLVVGSKERNGCVFKIAAESPTAAARHFTLNAATGALSLTTPVHLNSTIFADAKYAKVAVELVAECDDGSGGQNDTTATIDADDHATIKYDPKRTLVVVEIVESSESPLVFDEQHVFVGYPKQYSFVVRHPPSAVAQISVATSNKFEQHGDVEYAIEDAATCPFAIHPKSGRVYELRHRDDDGVDNVTFAVVATKTSNGRRGKMRVTVVYLQSHQIVEMVLKNASIDDRFDGTSSLGDAFVLKELSRHLIPLPHDEKIVDGLDVAVGEQIDRNAFFAKVFCYALDAENGRAVVSGSAIIGRLKKTPNVIDAQLAAVDERTCVVGYAYLVLSAAVLIFVVEICLAVVLCHFKCKSRKSTTGTQENDDEELISPYGRTSLVTSNVEDYPPLPCSNGTLTFKPLKKRNAGRATDSDRDERACDQRNVSANGADAGGNGRATSPVKYDVPAPPRLSVISLGELRGSNDDDCDSMASSTMTTSFRR